LFRSRNNASGKGIGDRGPLGRFLVRGEPGNEIIRELAPAESDNIIDKPGRGAFAHTDFEHILRLRGIKNLIFTGVTTDVCVSSTMRQANDRGFDCMVVSDATAAATKPLHEVALKSMKSEGGVFGCVGKVDDIIAVVQSG
jgi:nicotinamidase-related amidase